MGKINKIECQATRSGGGELKQGRGWGKPGVGDNCSLGKVVRDGLTEKVTFEMILEGNEGAGRWISGG